MTSPPHAAFETTGARIWVAGHGGMVGAAVARRLRAAGAEVLTVGRGELDLRRGNDVEAWLDRQRPDAVVVAAATVGGILDNDARPADFLYDNLAIAAATIEGARRAGVRRLMFLGSTCIYPRDAAQPVREDSLLAGPLEPTNQWYAVAKIAGAKLCEAYRRQHGCDFFAAMPTNLYGPGDRFDPGRAHVVPALIARLHEARLRGARSVRLWGTGRALRDFLHVDDAADALVLLLARHAGGAPVNVGSGSEVTILELARLVARTVGWSGAIVPDPSKPDGTPRKLADTSRLAALGWRPRIGLAEGLADAYRWYLETAGDQKGGDQKGQSGRPQAAAEAGAT
ncbi:GDP-L-fucose synthase [Arenibaculum sp.]|uniref:GDP-L-fucose synthase family protein n=1 Tax=Arenibaculum sp. TaxID=2865862 RepID=UPI002E0F32C0|nr:GDP-L-fucose synthase [Arenibaculum sp.]